MDLQHPAITQALKTGYPDDAGKPTNKIYFDPNYNRGREDYQMDILSDLVKTCIDNDLKIDIGGEIGIASIYDLRGDRAEIVSEGYIKNWEYESPQDTLERMTDELNDYLRGGYNE